MNGNNSNGSRIIDESFIDKNVFNCIISYIQNKALKDLATKLKEKVPIKEKRNIKNYNFSLNNVCFLTSKLSGNKKTEYILLKDLKKMDI